MNLDITSYHRSKITIFKRQFKVSINLIVIFSYDLFTNALKSTLLTIEKWFQFQLDAKVHQEICHISSKRIMSQGGREPKALCDTLLNHHLHCMAKSMQQKNDIKGNVCKQTGYTIKIHSFSDTNRQIDIKFSFKEKGQNII